MTDRAYSEHESENNFDKNEGNEKDNLDELFKGTGLEPYQYEPTKKIMKNYRKRAVRLRRKTSFLLIIGKTFGLERQTGADAKIVELSRERLTVFVAGKSMQCQMNNFQVRYVMFYKYE